jgi:hypothetical protein
MLKGALNETLRLRMNVAPPGTTKCHPSSPGATMPAQLPCDLKPWAVIGVGVFGSRGIRYEATTTADPVLALTAT